jgi:exopolysaccharide biosynthesis WecB/TagA/CpsF family protein
MYLFGGAEGIAGRAADMLRARHPGLRIKADSGPSFTAPEDMDREALERIEDVAPDILCVALGHPKQEHWIEAYRRAIGVPVLIGVGGALDFLTGTTRRAPEWMQRGGVEWLHRAAREPRRLLRRYARDAVRFGPSLLHDVVVTKGQAGGPARPCQAQQVDDGVLLLRPHGRMHLTPATLGWTQAQWHDPPAGHHVVIDLAELSMLGHAELGTVVGLAKRLSDNGGRLTLSSVPSAVAKVILDLRLYDFLSTSSTALFDHVPSIDDVASATVPAAPGATTDPSEPVAGERRMTNV